MDSVAETMAAFGDACKREVEATRALDALTAALSERSRATLADFLTARIAEDEERARGWGDTWASEGGVIDLVLTPGPARVLAECEAKRRILTDPQPEYREDYHGWHITKQAMLRYIAQPYADHPDFREEWRV
jgi:hypothetical protein